MSSEQKEWLSQASDNLSISAEQLDQLLSDPDAQATWLRYQAAGAAIRNELPAQASNQIADDFAAWLEQEPAHQLQAEPVVAAPLSQVKVQQVAAPAAANQSWWKYLMQGAIAAGVALVAVVGVQTQLKSDDAANNPLPVLQTSPIGGVAAPVSLSQTSVENRVTPEQQQLQMEQQRRLQELMQAREQQIRLMEQAAAQPQVPEQEPTQN